MERLSGTGQLIFKDDNYNNYLNVEWELEFGDQLAEGKTWKANIGFFSRLVSENIRNPVFRALSSPSMKMWLVTQDGINVSCHISDILNLADDGIIEVSSLDLAGAQMEWDENIALE